MNNQFVYLIEHCSNSDNIVSFFAYYSQSTARKRAKCLAKDLLSSSGKLKEEIIPEEDWHFTSITYRISNPKEVSSILVRRLQVEDYE